MKIGIDTQSVIKKKTGLGIYTENLVTVLKKIAPENEYVLLHSDRQTDLSTPQRWLWDQVSLPRMARRMKIDLLHKPCFSAPIFYDRKIILTVHDLVPNLFPENLSFSARMYWVKWMPLTYKKADKIIAVSESTKRDLIRYFKLSPDKIIVIHEGGSFDNMTLVVNEINKTRVVNKHHLPEKYLLTVGNLEPKKNLPFLIKSFYFAKKKFHFPEKLVIVGKVGWGVGPIFEQIKKYNLEKEVILPGYIDDIDLPVIYKMASVFVFPSLYEGFGLPVLDAMKLGCPVIVSKSSSLLEIVGNAGILADPKDEREWINAIGRTLKSDTIKREYRQRGLKQGNHFSWEKCAKKTAEVYENIIH